ncbi:MAG TPA: class I poly(R)-hydroxyalkanoic acid synthase [Burkholderiaceae bacterium]|jgi:polyhydroxyalkanoate synthase|nr:class I poly(R)-hydroxyalkanoic acid synthase [Burkholderiaceae bacterium]
MKMTNEDRAIRQAGDEPAPGADVATPPAPATATGDDPFGLASWMRWWLPATPPGSPSSGLSISPQRLAELQDGYIRAMTALWNDFVTHPERAAAPIGDPRFSDPAWQENSLASFTARAYLLNAQFMNELAANVEADPKLKARVRFAVSQWVDAAAPSNFLAFNPKAQKRLAETKGESLTHGLQNLLNDVAKGKISQSDEQAFEIGRNVATSEGAVVFENDLIQLIQYKPLTGTVRARPFLMVPPCINKFYILDLQSDNSFVRFCVERGNTVFLVSWRNPGPDQAGLTWDDYVGRGPIAALNAARDISGASKVNALGFCVGGTLIGTALSVMRAQGDDPVASLTLLTSLLDFSDSGILDIFIDETHVRMREETIGKGGLMPGRDLANTFSSLRANDLVWSYVVSNYLEGRAPPAFDLLYWNGDSTNLPGPMYAWYLRNTYLENNLVAPNKVRTCGVPVDLGRINVPTYVFAAREDHIVPWKGAYASARALTGVAAGQLQFVLGASGHIAGTVNPASKNRRNYWVDDRGNLPERADDWFDSAQQMPGSWWNHWDRWLSAYGDGEVAAPEGYGSPKYPAIEAAPGRYVRQRAQDATAGG